MLAIVGAALAFAFTPNDDGGIVFPFGKATELDVTPSGVTAAATVFNNMTILDLGTLDTAITLNITLETGIRTGAICIVKAASDATSGRNVTFGSGATAAVLSGTTSKTKTAWLVYDGTEFIGVGQID